MGINEKLWADVKGLTSQTNNLANDLINIATPDIFGKKQTELFNTFFKKIKDGTLTTLALQGDSIFYGLDKVSVDKRPAPATLTDNGTANLPQDTIAGYTIYEQLQDNINAEFGAGKITVVPKAYSGDDTEESILKWNVTTDMTVIGTGINDAINSTYAGNIDRFITAYRTLIEKLLTGDSAVIIMTPTLLTYASNVDYYRDAIQTLAKEYNIPVIRGELLLQHNETSMYSDGTVHFKTASYMEIADYLFYELFISKPYTPNGYKIINPTLLNGWVNFGTIYPPVEIIAYDDGRVAINGLIKSGSLGADCIVVPNRLLPRYTYHRPIVSNDVPSYLLVRHTGEVNVPSSASNIWVSVTLNYLL